MKIGMSPQMGDIKRRDRQRRNIQFYWDVLQSNKPALPHRQCVSYQIWRRLFREARKRL